MKNDNAIKNAKLKELNDALVLNQVGGGLNARKAISLVAFVGSSALAVPVLGLGNFFKCLGCIAIGQGVIKDIVLDGLTLAKTAEDIIKTASAAFAACYLFKGQYLDAPNTFFDETKLASKGAVNGTKEA